LHQRGPDISETSTSASADDGGTIEIDREADEHWRDVDPENLLIIRTESGEVLIELAPQFAPAHVDQMRRLAREGHYDQGATFYRVIDNFVAQGGVLREVENDEEDAYDDGAAPLPAEFERGLDTLRFVRNESADLHAPATGHVNGFAAGYDPETGTVWPLHCYGVIAMAREADPNTGSSHFYIVNGRDQRYLDRNLTVFGRVLEGMEHVQKANRGDRNVDSGVIGDPADRTPILGMKIAADLPPSERPRLQVMKSDSPAFAEEKERKFYRGIDFFLIKPSAVEACSVPGPVRIRPEER
jgi:peptidylprolyl isomerase